MKKQARPVGAFPAGRAVFAFFFPEQEVLPDAGGFQRRNLLFRSHNRNQLIFRQLNRGQDFGFPPAFQNGGGFFRLKGVRRTVIEAVVFPEVAAAFKDRDNLRAADSRAGIHGVQNILERLRQGHGGRIGSIPHLSGVAGVRILDPRRENFVKTCSGDFGAQVPQILYGCFHIGVEPGASAVVRCLVQPGDAGLILVQVGGAVARVGGNVVLQRIDVCRRREPSVLNGRGERLQFLQRDGSRRNCAGSRSQLDFRGIGQVAGGVFQFHRHRIAGGGVQALQEIFQRLRVRKGRLRQHHGPDVRGSSLSAGRLRLFTAFRRLAHRGLLFRKARRYRGFFLT